MVEFIPTTRFVGIKFEYNLADHLRNVRVTFTAHSNGKPETNQITSYDPFGFVTKQDNWYATSVLKNKFLYNGKEIQNDVLAGTSLDWYDYGARMYDASLGRWHTVDPLAEKYADFSPYIYVGNNPIILIDIDGRIWEPSEAIKNSHAYFIAMNTGKGQALKALFDSGNMKDHIYRVREGNIMRGTGGANMGFIRDGKYLPINAITAKDINNKLQLVFSVTISNQSLNSIEGAETFGHESFVHNQRKIDDVSNVLSLLGEKSEEWIAWKLQMIGAYEGDIKKEDGNYTSGGQLDHVLFLKGQKGTYNSYIGQLLNNVADKEKGDIRQIISSYVYDLVRNGDKNVRRYTGDDAKKIFEDLQKKFKK